MEQDIHFEMTEEILARLVACQKLALLGRIASSITHELNNHLTGVAGYTQLLKGQDRAKPVAEELEKIGQSAGRCQKLIEDLKRISRSGGLSKESNSVNLIIEYLLDLLRHQFNRKSLQIVEDYSTEVPVIEVDTPALEQVFLSIIQNSLDSLEEKGKCLSIKTLKEDGQVVAVFEDDGLGFSEDARAHLFTPFFTTKDRLRYAGLGLVVAKALVERHGGAIEVRNLPGGGASVRIELPCQIKTKTES